MGETMNVSTEHDSAVHHLTRALETDDEGEKQFHVRQALQLLGVAAVES